MTKNYIAIIIFPFLVIISNETLESFRLIYVYYYISASIANVFNF